MGNQMMDFLTVSNLITTYFQNITNIYGWSIRYENDPRTTPTFGLWCNCKLDFNIAEQKEIGINSYRNFGDFIIEIYHSIGMGISSHLKVVDIVVAFFTELTVSNVVKFQTPKIRSGGRTEDNHRVDIICPFYFDS